MVGPVAIVFGALTVVGGSIWIAWKADKKRTAAMQLVAQTMGFSLTESCGEEEIAAMCGALPIFDRGHSRQAMRIMRGTLAGRDTLLFDYRYTTGGGKSQHLHRQTMAVFPGAVAGVTDFTLGPENFMHKLGGVFGYQDIDFPDHPDFSKHYLLRGADETAIRDAFTSDVLAFLGGTTGWHIDVAGGTLAVYREGRWVPPEQMPTFAADALRIVGLFKSS